MQSDDNSLLIRYYLIKEGKEKILER